MEPSTRPHEVPVTQPDSTAAAAREAAPDDTGLGGSRGSLGVTWAELRVALWLSVACAVTAALVAVPAGAAYFFGHDLSYASLGEGADRKYAFRDTARMQRREPYTVEFDWSTTTAMGVGPSGYVATDISAVLRPGLLRRLPRRIS